VTALLAVYIPDPTELTTDVARAATLPVRPALLSPLTSILASLLDYFFTGSSAKAILNNYYF
jgi:hypothetical protein